MKKIREWRQQPGGGGGPFWENSVREVADKHKTERLQEPVAAETPEHDWRVADGLPPEGIR